MSNQDGQFPGEFELIAKYFALSSPQKVPQM